MRRAACLLTLLGVLHLSFDALARDAALAESLFRQGRALMDEGKYAEACPRLSESFAQDPSTGTLLALALCQERLGQTASAWANYSDVVARAKRDGRADRSQAAEERRNALEPKLSRLTIEVSPAARSIPGLMVTKDGQPIGKGAWGAAVPLDPGEHVIEATAPGRRTWSQSVAIGEVSDSKNVEVPELEKVAEQAVAPVASPSPDPSGEGAAVTDEEPRALGVPLRTLGLVVGGAGIVGLGVSGFFGLRAAGLNDDSKAAGHCHANNACDRTGLAARNDAIDASNLATVFLVTGTVLTATGATLFLVGGPREKATTTVEASPAVAGGAAALSLRGRF